LPIALFYNSEHSKQPLRVWSLLGGWNGHFRQYVAHLLDKNLAQAGLAAWVELVESVEDVLVRVHVQRIDVKVIPARHGRMHCH
jgi:hypothetical protein